MAPVDQLSSQDAPDEIAAVNKEPDSGGSLRTLTTLALQHLRQGEIGPLPVVLALMVIALYFGSQTSWVFLNSRNLSNLVLQIAAIGSVAIGIVLVLLLGEIDLSVGSIAGLTSAVLGSLVVYHNWPWWAAIIAMLAVGALIGAFQGAWFAFFGVPAFVVTLAGYLAWQGVQLRVLGSNGTINVFEPHIGKIAATYLPDIWGWVLGVGVAAAYAIANLIKQVRRRRAGLSAQPHLVLIIWTLIVTAISLGTVAYLNSYMGVPTAGVLLLGLVIFFVWLTTCTKFGRYIYAVGGNIEAARRAGISVRAIRIWVFTLAGFMAAVGGLIFTSRLTAASTQTGTGTFLLEAIAAAVIGGTSLFGGRGSVWAALLGALVVGSVSNGLDLMSQPPEIKYMVEGGILLAAVTVDAISRRGREAAGR
jgi:D-xylose transport system permease protein